MKKMLSRLFQNTPSINTFSTLHGTSQETLIPLDSLNFLPDHIYQCCFLMHIPWMIVILRFITNS